MAFDAEAKRWAALPKAAVYILNKIAMDATMTGIRSDVGFTDQLNSHLAESKQAAHASRR